MKEKLLLVGAGGLGRVVLEHVINNYECAFIDDGQELGKEICGIKIIGNVDDLAELRKQYCNLVVTIGNNQSRKRIYEIATQYKYAFPNVICKSVYISPFASIGWGCILLNNAVVQNSVSIGNGVIINPGVEMHHDSSVEDYSVIYTNSVVRTNAKIGKLTTIGSNVTICNNVEIGAEKIIKDGSSICLELE